MINCVDSTESPSTTGQAIPQAIMQAPVIAGYNHGNQWPSFGPYTAARPDLARAGRVVSITLTCLGSARCYDIEPGGGANANIGRFMQVADRSHGLPWLYTFASNVSAMLAAAAAQGYHQGRDFYVWAAHTGRGKHLCSPDVCGYPRADGTQWVFAGAVDLSILNDYMVPQSAPPVEHMRGLAVAELHYDHDSRAVKLYPKNGNVQTWGNVNETIHLGADLAVGSKHGTGEWSGRVLGASPR